MLSNHLILCCCLLLLTPIFHSIRIFSNESALCIRWPKYWSFSISPSKEYSGLISFRIDWFDLPFVQGILQARILKWKPFPSPGDLPDRGIKPGSPALQADSLPSEPLGKPWISGNRSNTLFSPQRSFENFKSSPICSNKHSDQPKIIFFFLKRKQIVSNTCLIRFFPSCQKTHLDWHTISKSSQILSYVDERGTRWWGSWKLFYESSFVIFSVIFLRQL